MIIPTRFGLKYAPIPTLALEYEDDLKGVVDATGESATSLYVYRDGSHSAPSTRKLHVVELPMLTRTSETHQITRQLQEDNGRFLAPGVVSEVQLKRLLDRLVENLPTLDDEKEQRQPSTTTTRVEKDKGEASESELEESAMETSVMEESVVEASESEELETQVTMTASEVNPDRGAIQAHDSSNDGVDDTTAEAIAGVAMKLDEKKNEDEDGDEADRVKSPAPVTAEKDDSENEEEAEQDAKKTRALRSDSDVSDEEVQSEELEYFSEDGSDEDSF